MAEKRGQSARASHSQPEVEERRYDTKCPIFNRDALSLGVLSLDMDRLDTFAPEGIARAVTGACTKLRTQRSAFEWLQVTDHA